jgi:hypothetical protein
MADVGRDLLGAQLAQMLESQRCLEIKLDMLAHKVERVEAERLVQAGILRRPAGREVESRGLLAMVQRLERRITALEMRRSRRAAARSMTHETADCSEGEIGEARIIPDFPPAPDER